MNEVEKRPALTACLGSEMQYMFFSMQSDYFYQVHRKFTIKQTNFRNPMRSPAHFEEEP